MSKLTKTHTKYGLKHKIMLFIYSLMFIWQVVEWNWLSHFLYIPLHPRFGTKD